jgi:hypothetical protein
VVSDNQAELPETAGHAAKDGKDGERFLHLILIIKYLKI